MHVPTISIVEAEVFFIALSVLCADVLLPEAWIYLKMAVYCYDCRCGCCPNRHNVVLWLEDPSGWDGHGNGRQSLWPGRLCI